MFELGTSLRQAREKRGLELDAVQRALRIRKRYLEALESERFEQLPGEVYARGFLREYAEFLGLDGSLYVDEYNERFAPHEETAIAAVPSVPRFHHSRWPAAAALLFVALVVAAGLAAWQFRGEKSAVAPTAVTTAAAPRPVAAPKTKPKPAAARKPRLVRLTLTAARGDCWVLVRAGSETGRILYERTLRQGSTVHFTQRRPLWVRVGAGLNLDARVGGRPLRSLPHMTGNLLIRA